MSDKAVITGIGVLAANGIGKEKFWESICSGKSGIKPVTQFDPKGYLCKVAGEIQDFEPEKYVEKQLLKRLDRFSQLANAGLKMAIEDANVPMEELKGSRTALVLGTAMGGIPYAEEQHYVFLKKGLHAVSPTLSARLFPGSGVNAVCIPFGITGYSATISTGCTSGIDALGHGLLLLRSMKYDYVIVGGMEAPISPLTFGSFLRIGVMSTEQDDPLSTPRPFDMTRSGIVLSEGAGVMILETEEHAKKRKAQIYAEVAGYSNTHQAYHLTQLHPSSTYALRAMEEALKDAQLNPDDLDYINAHGSGTRLNDSIETKIYKRLLGKKAYKTPITSSEGSIGHALGAGAAIKCIICALAIKNQTIPPTVNLKTPDPECDLDYVPGKARKAQIGSAMSANFSFGGKSSVAVFKQYSPN